MNIPELTVEQQFRLKVMRETVQQMSRQQLEELLIDATRILMMKENILHELLKDKLGSYKIGGDHV